MWIKVTLDNDIPWRHIFIFYTWLADVWILMSRCVLKKWWAEVRWASVTQPFQNTWLNLFLKYLFPHKPQKNENWKAFQNTWPNLFISMQSKREWKIERLSPKWRQNVFSKYSTNSIFFHTGHKRMENRLSP